MYIKNIINPIIVIPCCDILLVMMLGKTARWFQLHCLVNFIISTIIIEDCINLFITPHRAVHYNNNHLDSYYILVLHAYHCITFKRLKMEEIVHHIVFVLLGVVPNIYYSRSNSNKIGYLACCGIPGIIEYGTLTLVKHDKLLAIKQKRIASYMYCFLRQPLALYSVVLNIILYEYNIINYREKSICIYNNVLLYLNSCYYTYITCTNYGYSKYREFIY